MTFGLRVIPPTTSGSAHRQAISAEGVGPQVIVPEVGRGDLAFLCESRALGLGKAGAPQMIISQADSATVFGIFDTDARQIFTAFSSLGDSCIWETF